MAGSIAGSSPSRLLYLVTLLLALSSHVQAASRHHRRQSGTVPITPKAFLANDTIERVSQLAISSSGDFTWTAGTVMEALIELKYPSLSVFANTTIPPPASSLVRAEEVISMVRSPWWEKRVQSGQDRELGYVQGGSPADSAALGVGFLVANLTRRTQNNEYGQAVENQINYLLSNSVMKTSDGAISHRIEQLQLWNDYVSMVPPVLAYYGALAGDREKIAEAYKQCRLYRQYLRDSQTGLWRHIGLGSWQDNTLWATGNAWAAWGMTRVLATIKHSQYAASFETEMEDLGNWSSEIVNQALAQNRWDGLLPNWLQNTGYNFADAAASALIGATAYRLADLGFITRWRTISAVEGLREAIYAKLNRQTGWLHQVVDPLAFNIPSNESPEGQAFLMILEAAGRDYWSTRAAVPADIA